MNNNIENFLLVFIQVRRHLMVNFNEINILKIKWKWKKYQKNIYMIKLKNKRDFTYLLCMCKIYENKSNSFPQIRGEGETANLPKS